MTGSHHSHKLTRRHMAVHVVADGGWGNHIISALKNERRRLYVRQVLPVVGEKRDTREIGRDLRIGPAETVSELRAQLRTIGIAHDYGRHRARPPKVVAVE